MKNILITGASSGIGEACARFLVFQGYSVMLVGRNQKKLVQLCTDLGGNADYIAYDLENIDGIESIFQKCKERKFKLNGLVYCAGIGAAFPMRTGDWKIVDKLMHVNCLAFFEMAKFVINRKYSENGCSIVAMSSLSSVTCYPGMAAYSISKSSINTLCKVLSKEVTKRCIRVNTIMPGYVRTPMTSDRIDEDVLKEQPMGFIEPIEIAYLVEFLLSDKSKYITGTYIPISAGMNF